MTHWELILCIAAGMLLKDVVEGLILGTVKGIQMFRDELRFRRWYSHGR